MDIQPIQTQHRNAPAPVSQQQQQPRDLTWLGLADDRELLCRAREIAAQNILASQSTRVSSDVTAKLSSWRFAQG